MKPKIHIKFPNINVDIENQIVNALTDIGFEVRFSYTNNGGCDEIELAFQKKMSKDPIQRIIFLLEKIKDNKTMYFGTDYNIIHVEYYLRGVKNACKYLGVDIDDNIYDQVIKEHGWSQMSALPVNEMKEKGLTNSQIVDELINRVVPK
ncbi:MAG: hypothetical protein GY754_33950 [bacterium]|nr:hypothetical protein [bacterium]